MNLTQAFNTIAEDATQEINFDEGNTTSFGRKSLGRRVSFAAVAHIRVYEKDDDWKAETPQKLPPEDLLSFSSPDVMDHTLANNTAYNAGLTVEFGNEPVAQPLLQPSKVVPTPVRRLSGTIDNEESLIFDNKDLEDVDVDMDLDEDMDMQSDSSAEAGDDRGDDRSVDEEAQTMDLTGVIGGIKDEEDDDMDGQTMELTGVVGGIKDDEDQDAEGDDQTMDMTVALGGIKEVAMRRQSMPKVPASQLNDDLDRMLGIGEEDEEEDDEQDEMKRGDETSALKSPGANTMMLEIDGMFSGLESPMQKSTRASLGKSPIKQSTRISLGKSPSKKRQSSASERRQSLASERRHSQVQAPSPLKRMTVPSPIKPSVSPLKQSPLKMSASASVSPLKQSQPTDASPVKESAPVSVRSSAQKEVVASPRRLSNASPRRISLGSNIGTPLRTPRPGSRAANALRGIFTPDKSTAPATPVEEEEPVDPITLTEFLAMTNITFMDNLTTTKRRETFVLPPNLLNSATLFDYVKAAAITVPMLELYQFCCKELKKYIADGKEVVEAIDRDTAAENPLLFREYLEAPDDLREIMDHQFRLIKTHSRLTAKDTWYDWRGKLLAPVKAALETNLQQLQRDQKYVEKYTEQMESVLPGIMERHAMLKQELISTKTKRENLAKVDQDQLASLQETIDEQSGLLEEYQADLSIQEEQYENALERVTAVRVEKDDLNKCINAARKACVDNKCFTVKELDKVRIKYEELSKRTRWRPVQMSTSRMTLVYTDKVRVDIDLEKKSAEVSLEEVPECSQNSSFGGVSSYSSLEILFLRILSDTIKEIDQDNVKTYCQQVISITSTFWNHAKGIISHLQNVSMRFPVEINTDTEEAAFAAKVLVFIPSRKAKFHLNIIVDAREAIKMYPIYQEGAMDVLVDIAYGKVDREKVTTCFKRGLANGIVSACMDVVRMCE